MKSEKEILKALKDSYKLALDDVEANLKIYRDRIIADDEDTSAIYQYEYQMAIKEQLDDILDRMTDDNYEYISDYLFNCYERGYLGTLYQIQGCGVPLLMPINQNMTLDAIMKDTKLSKPLYKKLGFDVAVLKSEIASELVRGIAQGESWAVIARNIRHRSKVSQSKAFTIARTEGGRIQSMAIIDSQNHAKDVGADVVKRWDATLDGKTRPEHRELDGQVREIEEDFEVMGYKAKAPRMFDVAHLDINCRCASLTIPRWDLGNGFTKRNSFTDELMEFDDSMSYDSFKKQFFSDENMEFMQFVNDLQDKYSVTNFDTIKRAMNEEEYKKYSELLKKNPIYGEKGKR